MVPITLRPKKCTLMVLVFFVCLPSLAKPITHRDQCPITPLSLCVIGVAGDIKRTRGDNHRDDAVLVLLDLPRLIGASVALGALGSDLA